MIMGEDGYRKVQIGMKVSVYPPNGGTPFLNVTVGPQFEDCFYEDGSYAGSPFLWADEVIVHTSNVWPAPETAGLYQTFTPYGEPCIECADMQVPGRYKTIHPAELAFYMANRTNPMVLELP